MRWHGVQALSVVVLSITLLTSAALPSMGITDRPATAQGAIPEGKLGSGIWSNGTALEAIGQDYPAFRCAGSRGANASALWIMEAFRSVGLETWSEEYQFYGWDLLQTPELSVTYANGSGLQRASLGSFRAEHYSSSTGPQGVTGELVQLPIPKAYSYSAFTQMSFPYGAWDATNLAGKIVLVGREVRWNQQWEAELVEKLAEGPAALVFYYSQDWSSALEVMFQASCGGMPLSPRGSYLFKNQIPVGCVDAQDASALLALIDGNSTAHVTIEATYGIWSQSNIVARLIGEGGTGERVMLTAHYDSVTVPGFCDNALSVATVIGLASVLQELRSSGYRPAQDVYFVAFSGEEMGLVGSSYYYSQHAEEIEDVIALINLDCLGAGTMTHTPATLPDGTDLGLMMEEAARSEGMLVMMEEGNSDHRSFLAPSSVASSIQAGWGRSPVISLNAPTVPGAISVLSRPLSPMDGIGGGEGGWIHTAKDSSEHAPGSGWVTEEVLDLQANAVLSVLLQVVGEVEPQAGQSYLMVALLAVAMAGCAAVIIFILMRRK